MSAGRRGCGSRMDGASPKHLSCVSDSDELARWSVLVRSTPPSSMLPAAHSLRRRSQARTGDRIALVRQPTVTAIDTRSTQLNHKEQHASECRWYDRQQFAV